MTDPIIGTVGSFDSRVHRAKRWHQRARIMAALLVLVSSLLVPSGERVHAVDVPILLEPADGSTATVNNYTPLGIPNFTWLPVSGATSYRIQFSTNIGFSPPTHEKTTALTSYTPTDAGPFADGPWYWRVRVESPVASGYQFPPWSFTKEWASVGNAPALLSPADGAVLEFFDQPVFAWQPVTGAASYKLQIDSGTDFNPPDYTATTLARTHQPKDKLANAASYNWRVVPLDPANREGTPSAVRTFDLVYNQVPTLIEPLDNAEPVFTPAFRWAAVRGAQYYRLQYTTDPSFLAGVNTLDTENTSHTPSGTLPNDVNYYWRVRTHSGASVSNWSQTRTFVKRWYIKPDLLTPVNTYLYVNEPVFSWTPVAGARAYNIQFEPFNAFAWPPDGTVTVNPFFVKPEEPWQNSPTWYWRVTPIDGGGNFGSPSNVFSFNNPLVPVAPRLIYPLYYYSPTAVLQPHEDRTAPLPVFMWHRSITPTDFTVSTPATSQAAAYRLQVSTTPLFFSTAWDFDTENLSAAPTAADPFTPTVGGIYYWRVSRLDAIGGSEVGQWSQTWKARIDPSLGLVPTSNLTPTLLRPAHGSEIVDTTPLLEWWPKQGADSYEVQISQDAAFASSVTGAIVPYPVYAHPLRLGPGTYYWRVRARSSGAPIGTYSAAWRFQVAAPSRWRQSSPRLAQVASDPAGDMTDPNFDVTNLDVAQTLDHWWFRFSAAATATDMTYGLYLDLDHVDGSGATFDAMGVLGVNYNITTIPAHRPEFAVYMRQISGSLTATDTFIFQWTGSGWGFPIQLINTTGGLSYVSNTVVISMPNTAIGMQDTTGSAAISLFSAMAGGGHAQDTVPADPNVSYTTPVSSTDTTILSRFASVSERLMMAMPPSNTGGDPTDFPSVPPFFWHLPVDVPAWCGYSLQVHKDPVYTNLVAGYSVTGDPLIPPNYTHNPSDLEGDNTYFWRVRPIYHRIPAGCTTGTQGAWSQPTAFDREGFVVRNLTTSVTFATPTFSWEMAEGAERYDLQVDADPSFGTPEIDVSTPQNSYTPSRTFANGTYYWRVRVGRYGNNVHNDWSPIQSFVLSLPLVTGLNHFPTGVVDRAPTLCWDPLVVSSGGNPVLAAWKYRVQVSKDPTFSAIWDTIDTEQKCWTPLKGYDDGDYHWRVAMIDGEGRLGGYSSERQFTKQYPVTTLLSPTAGSSIAQTPTFIWAPVNGAAKYRLQVSRTDTFPTPFYDSVDTHNTRYTPTFKYATNQAYFWRVAIIDRDGKVGPFTDATLILDPLPFDVYLPLVIR